MNSFTFLNQEISSSAIKAIKIGLASPEKILEWSYGEVKKPETINYRTFKPERDGLFCAKIFGPVKDYECICGKYKRMKHRGIVCEKCGVEVIESKVRRERMGHIRLAAPVVHIWFLRNVPSVIALLLDMTQKEVESVVYYENYIVIDPGDSDLKVCELISEDVYYEYSSKYENFKAGTGAEAIKELLKSIDVHKLSEELREQMKKTNSESTRKRIANRLKIVEAFKESGNKPEWMVIEILPVIPPELRPLVPLEGGRFATSDLNDLYRRVINRNNRLKRLIDLNAPEIIIRNEKRMLQEAVDALLDNTKRPRPILGSNKKPLKSLSDQLKGKQGRFRQNLLGKRVDYSGRSVIVVGPELKLHECGLPRLMALELFKPFIYQKLREMGIAPTVKAAKKIVERKEDVVWDILEEVVKEHPVLLNRAPTLHRLGIQAFEPVLVEGKAIRLHPLVCPPFNADFDGDQMAVHVPLSLEAQTEARVLMLSSNNILSPANGRTISVPTQDIVLGVYYLTKAIPKAKGEGMVFSSPDEVRMAYDRGVVDIHAIIKVRIDGKLYETTVGRIIFREIVPEEIPFDMYNKLLRKKDIVNLLDTSYRLAGPKKTVIFADKIKELGFDYATRAGISIAIDDLKIPRRKDEIIEETTKEVMEVEKQYREGLITHGEKYNKVIDIWTKASDIITEELMKELSKEKKKTPEGEEIEVDSLNSIYIMADSGARGSTQQIKQLAGMRGLMAKPSGEIIETPITSNFREGLSVLQYFISTHGARKGLADTALKTANSGYLTRKLIDVAHDVFVTEYDCGTIDGIEVGPIIEGGEIISSLEERILGRIALEDIEDPYTGEIIVRANEEIDEEKVKKIIDAGIDRVKIRSVLTCQAKRGVCALCYGRDLARGTLVNIGEAVGIIAAQSIGEPGTQLTMRTFHIGGTASKRVEQSSHQAKHSGIVRFHQIRFVIDRYGNMVVMNRNGQLVITTEDGREIERYPLVYGAKLLVRDGDRVKAGQTLAEWDPYTIPILSEVEGKVKFGDIIEGITMSEQLDEVSGFSHKVIIESKDVELRPRISIKDESGKTIDSYYLPIGCIILVNEGDHVKPGDPIGKIPRETTKTKDITGGLPRVTELFEARKPKEPAVVTEIDGVVSFGKIVRGRREIIVTPEVGEPRKYIIPRGKHVIVQEGDFVKAGEPLMDGPVNLHDILRIRGEKAVATYLVEEIQKVYLLQGVKINDKHFEIIVRQMLSKVRVTDVGDTKFVVDDIVDKWEFREENERVIAAGGKPATAEPLLLGITKASLSKESFISAASFQETTRVLTKAAIEGRVDHLYGLKENIIVGRLIPAGTGMKLLKNVKLNTQVEEEKVPTEEKKLLEILDRKEITPETLFKR